MGFETAPPNGFRATLRSGRGPLVVADKHAKVDTSATGLAAVLVSRSENRRTNQRGGDRHRLSDEQALVRRKGKRHVVDLINLSQDGAMVRGKFTANLWDRVDLVLGETGGIANQVECAVRWIRGDRFGLEFAHETRVDCDSKTLDDLLLQVIRHSFPDIAIKPSPVAVPDAPEHQRGEIRHPMIWNGVLRHNAEWETFRLRNISRLGAMIECPVTLAVGAVVKLELSEIGRLTATVSWSRGNQSGLEFDQPFDVRNLSRSKPEIAPQPSSASDDRSPWAAEWNRLSVSELRDALEGFLKH